MYNAEKYIEECIESALQQRYEDLEIIVVNDGSTDNSLQIANKFANKIKIVNKKNGGTASALNAGIDQMSGEWFKWLSADDVLEDNAIEMMMNLVDKTPDNTQYIYYTDFTMIDEDSKFISVFKEPERNNFSKEIRNTELLSKFYGNGSTTLIHKSTIDHIGKFREGLPHSEDWEYWLRACIKYNYSLFHLPINILKYRIHKESLTSTKDVNENWKITDSLKNEYFPLLSEDQKKYFEKFEKSKPLKRRILNKLPMSCRTLLVKAYRKIK